MRARLKRDVERRAARPLARLFERDDLGVLDSRPGVEAATDDFVVPLILTHDHRADRRVGADAPNALLSEIQRFFQKAIHELLLEIA